MKKSIMIGMAVLAAAAVMLTVAGCGHQDPPTVPTETPVFNSTTAAKNALVEASVDFKLKDDPLFSDDAVWKVYTYVPGGVSSDVTASVKTKKDGETETHILTLKHSTDIPERLYWVTVTETGPNNVESDKVQLEVTAPTDVSTAPVADTGSGKTGTTVTKGNAKDTSVDFDLSAAISGTLKVYIEATGGTASSTVKASYSSTGSGTNITHTLTLKTVEKNENDEEVDSEDQLSAGSYWVTATESGKAESTRLKLTVKDPV